jgi:hypothetical protein
MDEAELTSDLLVAQMDGIKSRKATEAYYKKYDDELKEKKKLTQDFRKTMDVIGAISSCLKNCSGCWSSGSGFGKPMQSLGIRSLAFI